VSPRIIFLAMIAPLLWNIALFTDACAQDTRAKFTRDFAPTEGWVKPVSGLKLQVYHDEDIEVFVNGVLALRRGGHVTEYEQFDLPAEAAAAIKPGRNILAVHCLQTAGAQFVDVGLGRAAGAASDHKPHNLLLDGPPEMKPSPER
jgi:hypothetical protein